MISSIVNDSNYRDIVRKLITDTRKVSKGSNLQNISSRTKEGEMIRRCFIPAPGFLFIGADLSQIEPRLMAHRMYTEYGDNSLRQIYIDEKDLYTQMAVLAFNLPELYCTDKGWYDPKSGRGGIKREKTDPEYEPVPDTAFYPRKLMKGGVLAVSYQQKKERFAENMGVSMEVADLFFENFNRSFPSFSQMVQDTIDFMKTNGYVETIYGRKRRFPLYAKLVKEFDRLQPELNELYRERKKLFDQNGNPKPEQRAKFKKIQDRIREITELRSRFTKMEREAFNATIQGAGADVLKMNGNRMARICMEKGWMYNASIHDELIISVPKKDVTPETIKLVNDVMCKTVELSVPLKSDVVIMPRWMAEYSPEDWDFENCRPKQMEGEE